MRLRHGCLVEVDNRVVLRVLGRDFMLRGKSDGAVIGVRVMSPAADDAALMATLMFVVLAFFKKRLRR